MSTEPMGVTKKGRLVVTRQVGESLWIGDNIEVRLDSIEAKRARFLIVAPSDVVVRRNGKVKESDQ